MNSDGLQRYIDVLECKIQKLEKQVDSAKDILSTVANGTWVTWASLGEIDHVSENAKKWLEETK